jgi:protein ImuB
MAAPSASRGSSRFAAFHRRLGANGKPPELALVATTRKMLTTLNAMARTDAPWREQTLGQAAWGSPAQPLLTGRLPGSPAGATNLDRHAPETRTKQEHLSGRGTVRRMGGRYLSLWLPEWPIERMRLKARRNGRPFPPDEAPLALVAPERGVPRLAAVNPAGRASGLGPGLALADARAICPGLLVRDAEPAADAGELAALGLWCTRYSPRAAVDGADGLGIDLTGCAHLFGGERGLASDLGRCLARFGLTHRLAVADRLVVAWAWARFGEGGVLPAGGRGDALAALPVAALRLDEGLLLALRRLGFRRVGQLASLPRAALATRFGPSLAARLDRLLGEGEEEEFVPLRETRAFTARVGWPEPIGRAEDIAAAAMQLLASLCRELERAQAGARRLRLGLHRVDGKVARLEVGTGRPVRDAAHLFRLLALELDGGGVDVGFGVEFMLLEAVETAPLGARQTDLASRGDQAELDHLVDQLAQRLGASRVVRLQPVDSHVPERAQRLVPAGGAALDPRPWLARQPRPLRLLAQPEPVEAVAEVPDGPPRRLGCRRVTAATGPERILAEWWRPGDARSRPRDYYRVTVEDGQNLWVYREGTYGEPQCPRWRVQGRFA